ncbi:acyltransferase family protein [Janthinobacterium fluminis]|uniref:Acyltransferase n=1 Tax=Janthinobacterium fluminis TaxID=2987524 RepID=A0ABT5JXZ6_9BURK|nr:acyltransferase [Janthinobacterium fluminis]MDC8757610.1 acyltransferase [Janthinobacterium fluminis]
MTNRINYLDGHRGLAILLVIGYHVFSRWSELVPYGAQFANIPLFKAGWVGVQLFFLISGFVILMTLEKCQGARDFLYRRWLRLFPAMLICALLIYLTAGFFHERPAGMPPASSLLPSLTFIEPQWWESLLGSSPGYLEGSFWSLYVEVKFYVFSALVFYAFGREKLIYAIFGAYGLAIGVAMANAHIEHAYLAALHAGLTQLSFIHFGWFAAGAGFYLFHKSGARRWFWLSLAAALLSAGLAAEPSLKHAMAAMAIAVLFAVSVASKKIQSALNNRLLVTMGAISYPLYLLHENMLISMVIKLGKMGWSIPPILLPALPLLLLCVAAYVIATFGERAVRAAIELGRRNLLPLPAR